MIKILKTGHRTAWRLFVIWWLSICGITTAAYAQKTQVLAASTPLPEIRIVIPDVRMCPGEEYDLPVYIETAEPIEVCDFTLGFRFPDYMIVEPVSGGLVTNLDEDLRAQGSPGANYSENGFANVPSRVFAFNWYANPAYGGGLNFVTLNPGQLLFRFRVRYKQEGDGGIDLVVGSNYPSAADYSHFIIKQAGTVYPSFDMAYVRPSAPPEVRAFSDTTVCVLSETRLWAEGGVQFYWEDISPVASSYRPAIAEPRVQNPIFHPLDPGLYTYRVKITSKTGCSAYDTVNYLVLDNGLNLVIPKDTMVDFDGTALLNTTVYGGYPPYNLSWEPAALVQTPLMANLTPARAGGRVEVENLSRPLQKPQWFTLRVQDRYCALEKRQSVNVVGSDMEAVMTMNPQYVCATQKLNTAVTFKVDVRGGMGRYKYYWSAENLEPGQKAPEFETTQDGPTARVRLYARCVVHVDVSDEITRKVTRFTDTVRILDQTLATVTIEDKNGSACEMTEMTFTAKAVNGGDHPHYSWRIDGSEVFAGSDPVFKTYLLRAGSIVSCVLTSDKACVGNTTATATIKPDVVTPGYMAVRPTFGSDKVNVDCGDSLSLGVVHRHTGSRFRLRWFRNDNELVYDGYVHYDSPVETEEQTVWSKLPRGGYYDYYRAAVTESDRACLLWDSVITERIYPRLTSSAPVGIGPAATKTADDTAGVCGGSTVAVYARGVRNLPAQFRLVWYKKKPGAAAEPIGYYAAGDRYTDNSAYGRDLGQLYRSEFTPVEEGYFTTWAWAQKEFPLYIRVDAASSTGNETPVADGDSLYYRLETAAQCSAKASTLTSSRFVVKVLPSIATTVSAITHLQPASLLCEGSVARFKVDVKNYAGGQCHWYYNGQDVQEVYPDWLTQKEGALQDTLTVAHYHKGDTIGFRYYSSYKCASGSRWTPMLRTSVPSQSISTGVYPFTSPDTMVCAGAALQLKAKGTYSGNNVYGVNFTIHWADSRAALEAGEWIGTDSILNVVVDSARFGDRSADLNKDSAVVGVIPYYVYITNDIGCTGLDSVMVTVAYRRRPSVRVVPVPEFPWCEGNLDNAYFKLEGDFWGDMPLFAILATRTYSSGTFTDWELSDKPEWPYKPGMFKEGYPIAGAVLASMITCTDREIPSDSIYLEFRERPEVWVSDEKPTVCQGDELTVTGYGCTMGEYARLYAMGYSEDEMMDALAGAYDFAWYDASGQEVSNNRILKVTPTGNTTYTLLVQDKEGRCAIASKKVEVTMALKTGLDIVFTDAATGKEVPFSMCAGSDSVAFVYQLTPKTPVGRKAYYGFVVVDIATGEEKDFWTQRLDDKFPVQFYPGERLVYYCVHDTVSCWGETYDMDSVDIQMSRPESASFVAGPDTMLCETGGAYLYISGAMTSAAALPAGAPSLKAYLESRGVAGMSAPPEQPVVYWWPQAGIADPSDRTSFMPFVSPEDNTVYYVFGYNEYGCIQADSVRVERFNGEDIEFKLVLGAADSLLCDSDELSFSLDRGASSILTLFDSLVWRRARPTATLRSGGIPSAPSSAEVLAVNTDRLDATVAHGDTIYVEGLVKGDGLCAAIDAAWYVSNKIVVKSYRRPPITLSQLESAACVDSLLEMHAFTEEGATLYWTFGPKAGGGVGTVTPQYSILDGGRPRPDSAWCSLLTKNDFTAVAEAYHHPACVGVDSIRVQVKKSIDSLRIRISDVPAVCGTDPVEIKVTVVEKADSWRWWVNGRPLMASDLADDGGEGIASLANRMESVVGRFTDGDLIWVEAQTAERCAYTGAAVSDTVRIRRSESPVWRWLAMDSVDAAGVQMTIGCAEEPLPLRLLVEKGGGLHAEEWRSDGTHGERTFTRLETTPEGQLYGLETVYPASETWLYIGLGYENCSVEDSIRIIGLPHEKVEVKIESAELSVCAGMEVAYGLVHVSGVDSVVWYVNDRPVLSGEPYRAAVSYTYRPEPGDSVWVMAYRRFGRCVDGNGARSNVVRVEVLSDRMPLEAVLTAEADSVCGAGALTYTVSGRGFDSVYWYANGELAAVTDLLSGASTLPETRTAAWNRVPREAGEGIDSLYALAVRRNRVCGIYDSLRTNTVSVYRRAMPTVTIIPRDTTVVVGEALGMQAAGAAAYIWWTDADDLLETGATFTLMMPADTVTVYTMGYEPAYGPDGLAGGVHAAPASDAYGDFGCRAYDSVRVLPGEAFEEVRLFVPNAVLLNSAHPADRVFKVFGEDVTTVHMKIYNSGGDLVFEKTGESPVWKPAEAATGNYVYRLTVTLKDGGIIKKNGWISVIE